MYEARRGEQSTLHWIRTRRIKGMPDCILTIKFREDRDAISIMK